MSLHKVHLSWERHLLLCKQWWVPNHLKGGRRKEKKSGILTLTYLGPECLYRLEELLFCFVLFFNRLLELPAPATADTSDTFIHRRGSFVWREGLPRGRGWTAQIFGPLEQARSGEGQAVEQEALGRFGKTPELARRQAAPTPLPSWRQAGPTSPSSCQGLRGSVCLCWPGHFHKLLCSCFY